MDNQTKKKSLNIIQWNCQSLKPKLAIFKALLYQDNVHIAILSETWLSEDFDLNVSGYNIYRKDRIDGYGGVAIIVHKSIKSRICNIIVGNVGIEIVYIKVLNCNNLENIVSIYCPSPVRTSQADWDGIFSKFGKNSIVAGDFNAHHTNWTNKSDIRGNQLQEACLEYGLISINNGESTRIKLNQNNLQETSPDVTFVSTDIGIDFKWQVTKENLSSDHLIIKYTLNYTDRLHLAYKRNFKKADWHSYCVALKESFSFTNVIPNIQESYNLFIDKINNAANKHIPMIKICTNPTFKFKPQSYWCTAISEAVAKRRLALGDFRRNPTPNNLNKLEEKILESKKLILRYKSLDWQNMCNRICDETSGSIMWDKMRWVKGYKKRQFYASDVQKHNLLCKLAPDYVPSPMPEVKSSNSALESPFSLQELTVCLKKKDTAPGEDAITYSMIYNLPLSAKMELLKLYNNIISSGQIPHQWRDITVVPIPKPGINGVGNLRPISLISCICKIFHSMLTKRIEWFIEKNKLFSQNCSGFRKGQSCIDCLARVTTYIQEGFSRSVSTLAGFLDIEGAYNNVVIDEAIKALDRIGIGLKICRYLWGYLSERHLKIKADCDGDSDVIRWTNMGLAQGDPISPLLFNIVTREIMQNCLHVEISQYADDFVLYIRGNHLQECVLKMQSSINSIVEKLRLIGLEPSPTKTKICLFTRQRKIEQINIKIYGQTIEVVDCIRYLGVWLDKSLRWTKHVNEISERATRYLNILRMLAGSGWGIHPKHLRRIYISLIRSRLDFGCYLYDNSAKTHLVKLDRIQNQALRIMGGFIRSTPIHVMESEMCIPPLYIRRKYLAYKYCIKTQSWGNNATVNSIDSISNIGESRYWLNKKKPLLSITYRETRGETINASEVLEMFSLNSWVSNIKYDDIIRVNLNCVNKSKGLYEINNLKHEVILELHDIYSDFYKVYTDGSKCESGVGAGIYDPNLNIHRLFKVNNKYISILTAELIAIFEALKYITEIDVTKVVILTDSKSALQHIIRCTTGCNGISVAYSILKIIEQSRDRGLSLRLQWIPSHIGLMGNEEADRLANLAHKIGNDFNIKPHYSEVFSKFKSICLTSWSEYFNERSRDKGIWYRTIQSEPPHIPWFVNSKINRNKLVVAFRIRSGHIPLGKFKHLMKLVDSPNCEVCGEVEDVYHVLVACVRNHNLRETLMYELNLNFMNIGVFNSILCNPLNISAMKVYRFVTDSLKLL